MGAPLFGREHADRYRETDGEDGHDWQGTTVLLLTTTGRKSGAKRTTPLIYQRHGDDFLVVASNGGGDPPGWFLNLQADPIVVLQVKLRAPHRSGAGRHRRGEARAVAHHDRDRNAYDEFQARADRDIPVVVLELSSGCTTRGPSIAPGVTALVAIVGGRVAGAILSERHAHTTRPDTTTVSRRHDVPAGMETRSAEISTRPSPTCWTSDGSNTLPRGYAAP